MSAAAFERQLKPIYDAIDTGSNKSAILSCNKLLKKHPNNELLKALKALAYVRSQKVEESLLLCDEVLAARPTDESVLSAMSLVLRGLGRHVDTIKMFEDAFKTQPLNEELGAQTFFANVRVGNWKAAQQLATKLHKQFQEDRYIYWNVMSAIMQASDPATPPELRPILYKLAHRLVTSSPTPSYVTPDRFHLHLTILRELELWDEAHTLLTSDVGKSICSTSLVCDELRRDIWQRRGLWKEEGELARERIVEKKDRNWLEFLSVLDATFSYVAGTADVNDDSRSQCLEHITKTQEFLVQIMEEDGIRDRSAPLALLELEKRARAYGVSSDKEELFRLLEAYFRKFGDKACCFEDLKPYVLFEGDDLTKWTSFLESVSVSYETVSDLRRSINVQKLLRFNLAESALSAEQESARAQQYLEGYLEGLKLGQDLPLTELQHADDFAILAAQAFVSAWKASEQDGYLYNAASVLEFGLTKSKHAYQMRLLLIQIYRLLAAPTLALEHYRSMDVKQVQCDTLSHFVLSRASTFSLASMGDLTFATECLESSQIYMANSQETAEYVVRGFTMEKYSQVPDFIEFEDRLDNSLQRDLVKIEHVRMRTTHEAINSELIDMELIELKFIFDRLHHDNRDTDILLNYQPRCQGSAYEQTLLFNKSPGMGWLWIFLKIYIRALQQASDVDETVEEKLLIGDRPKASNDPDNRLPLKERLAMRKEDELKDLTVDEQSFLEFTTALADWLEPYHNYVRPPPSVVLAEASKQTELKTGKPLQGIEIPPANANGSKKDEEPPQVKDAPDAVVKFFDGMASRFEEGLKESRSAAELLHIATLTQEALIVFAIETNRFKQPSVVKIHKLGALVQSFKSIRTNATTVLKNMSKELTTIAEQEGTSEKRKTFVDACAPLHASNKVDPDFVLNVAKKVTDARKKVLDGVGKGITKVCATHTARS